MGETAKTSVELAANAIVAAEAAALDQERSLQEVGTAVGQVIVAEYQAPVVQDSEFTPVPTHHRHTNRYVDMPMTWFTKKQRAAIAEFEAGPANKAA